MSLKFCTKKILNKKVIVEGFVQRIADGDVPETIEGKKVSRNYLILMLYKIVFVT